MYLLTCEKTEAKKYFEILDSNVSGEFKNIFTGATSDFTREKSFEIQAWEYLVYEK
jgi:hypothetical protein